MANENDYANQNNNIMGQYSTEQYSPQISSEERERVRSATGEEIPTFDSIADLLIANVGNYVLIEFLIGTGSLVDKEGFLYASGVNFVTIYEPVEDKYIICDLYSVKFVTVFANPPAGAFIRQNAMRSGRNYMGNSSGYGVRR